MSRNRVLVIGLDGATWNVLGPFIEVGALPNLARIKSGGSWGDLRSTIPPLSAPAWATFLTGKSPARHGVFHFVDWDVDEERRGDSRAGLVNGSSIDSPLIWDVLGHEDLTCGVINVPMSYPPRPIRGFTITGLLTPPNAPVFTFPPELSDEIGDYQIDLDRFIADKPFAGESKRIVKPDLSLIDEFKTMESLRGAAALRLMKSEPWDVFTVVFTGTDRMGHYLWPYHRAEDLDGTDEAATLHAAVRDFYVTLDKAIGDLVEEAGPDSTLFVISDHGMGPIYAKNTHWNTWLFNKGYLKLKESSTRTVDGWLLRLGIPRDKLRRWVSALPGGITSKAASALREAPTAAVDRAGSKVYYQRWFDPVGGFHINAVGAERETLIESLLKEVAEVTDPENGQPILREAHRREDCLSGPYVDRAPDIVMIMNPDYGSSDRVSSYSAIVTPRPHIGDPGGHQMEGVFIAAGPGIDQSTSAHTDLLLEDVAPTILHVMGLAIPSDMDGKVLSNIFTDGGLHDRPVSVGDAASWWPDEETARSSAASAERDEEGVRDRLRALGYFE